MQKNQVLKLKGQYANFAKFNNGLAHRIGTFIQKRNFYLFILKLNIHTSTSSHSTPFRSHLQRIVMSLKLVLLPEGRVTRQWR